MADARTTIAGELGLTAPSRRRDFLKLASLGGIGLALPALFGACNDDPLDPTKKSSLSFGNDTGPLNLMYATLQMQADFYARIVANRYTDMGATELIALTALNTQKATPMRNGLQSTITAGRITDAVLFDFQWVDFSSRTDVLSQLQAVEDMGVAAVIGSMQYVKTAPAALLMASGASMLGRHSAMIRDLNNPTGARTAFSGNQVTNGLNVSATPTEWYALLDKYYLTTFDLNGV